MGWGRGDRDARDTRSGMRRHQDRSGTLGGKKQKEPFSASNESKVTCDQRDRPRAQADHLLFVWCVYGWNLRLDFELTRSIG